MSATTVVLVPGLRGHVEDHWQTRLAATLPDARTVPPLGRADAGLRARVTPRDQVVERVAGPVVLVAHSAGALVTVGHLNPASGFGDWPGALPLVDELLSARRRPALVPA
jgi:predicted alpha/beta hydrolase family esterase